MLYLLSTLFLWLLCQLHLKSSGIRSQKLGTPALMGTKGSNKPCFLVNGQKKMRVSRVALNQNQIQRAKIHSTCPLQRAQYKKNVQQSSSLKLSRKYRPLGRNAANQRTSQIRFTGWQATSDSCGRTGVSLRNKTQAQGVGLHHRRWNHFKASILAGWIPLRIEMKHYLFHQAWS